MTKFTREQASARADCRLAQALNILHSHNFLSTLGSRNGNSWGDKDIWSAIYSPLTSLLGEELTKLLHQADAPVQQYEFKESYAFESDPPSKALNPHGRSRDHAVPLRAIIEHLLEDVRNNPDRWPLEEEGVSGLRKFMIDHIVIVDIPGSLNAHLNAEKLRHKMPDQYLNWHLNKPHKEAEAAMWGRYLKLGIVPPDKSGTSIVRLS